MIGTGAEQRVKVRHIIENQVPEWLRTEAPKTTEFLKQYYYSLDSQGLSSDLVENLDKYIKLDFYTIPRLSGVSTLSSDISSSDTTISVDTTAGYPVSDGLLKVNDEIVYYTGITTNSFTGCVRGFSGITHYEDGEINFSDSSAAEHSTGDSLTNLSTLFVKEFFRNLKIEFAPGFEDESFDSSLNVNNFIKGLRSFYNAKGTEDSFNILISALFGKQAKIKNQVDSLIQSSSANYRNRLFLVVDAISGDPLELSGQTLLQDSNDTIDEINGASAPISEVEFVTRGDKSFYNIYLFSRFSDPAPGFSGEFAITPSTRSLESVSPGATTISVDTTIGFPKVGVLVSGGNTSITYTDKTINQFLGCSGITTDINITDIVRTNDIAYATDANGNRVEVRITGVISDFKQTSDIFYSDLNEVYQTKTVGKKLKNPAGDKTPIQIIGNSWIYNTASTLRVESFSGSTFTLELDVDKAYLRTGDKVQVINRADNSIAVDSADVTVSGVNQVILSATGISALTPGAGYSIRRIVKKAEGDQIAIDPGNGQIISDVLNTYTDAAESELYVASNSLPSYNVGVTTIFSDIAEATVSSGSIQDFDATTEKYNIISFPSDVEFVTGDEVFYTSAGAAEPIDGLSFDRSYYVEVLSPANKVKLYFARSFIFSGDNIQINESEVDNTGGHRFILNEQNNKKISGQKLLKRFPIQRSLDTEANVKTTAGTTGLLINGVEVGNYKTDDKIFYGPIKDIQVLNKGKEYSVNTPPRINVTVPNPGGTKAEAYPNIVGTLQNIYVDPVDFGIESVASIDVKGGNGVGALVEPIVEDFFREIEFIGSQNAIGGGIDPFNDTITTLNLHNLGDGTAVVYNPNGNAPPPVTSFGSTLISGRFLETGTTYITEVVSSTKLRLYENTRDFNAGVNTVGFSTGGESGGSQILRLAVPTKKITGVNVLNPGEGYETRQIAIKTTGVSTVTNALTFENHGYSEGELLTYATTGTPIAGLSTDNQYFVIGLDADRFRLSDAGVGGTDKTNFSRGLVQNLTGIGTGLHIFNYPEISVDVNVTIANTTGVITATPVVTGPLNDVLLYEGGMGYGTSILNFEKAPTVEIQNGKGAEFTAVIVDGVIQAVNVSNQGEEYFSLPVIEAEDDIGTGALLRPIINTDTGKITDVVVIRGGVGYALSTTSIKIKSQGSGAFPQAKIRDLTINGRERFSVYDSETVLNRGEEVGLQYVVTGINSAVSAEFQDTNPSSHSPLLGWAYDGNPIYGPKGYTDPSDASSGISRLESGYELDISQVVDRPNGFPAGFFVEDYIFNDIGDLDIHNGRFSKTPEYPKGIYAYYATNAPDGGTGDLVSTFPYFIGNTYRSQPILENLIGNAISINQDFDFNSSGLFRNTFPYVVSEDGGGYDFYVEPYEFTSQRVILNNIKTGGVEGVEIINGGSNYKVDDPLIFDDTDSGGTGASAKVTRIGGQPVESITQEFLDYDNIVFDRVTVNQIRGTIGTFHELRSGDVVRITGLSTFVRGLDGFKNILVPQDDFSIQQGMPPESVGGNGISTDIKVSPTPEFLRPDSEIIIEDETLKVLNVFTPAIKNDFYTGIVRAVRGTSGTGHTIGAAVTAKSSTFTVELPGESIGDPPNVKIYFNPNETVGFGTTVGGHVRLEYEVLGITSHRGIPIQTIYIENHPFKNNQKVLFGKPDYGNPLSISTVSAGATFNFPISGDTQEVFVVNKGKNSIGIKTELTSELLFFNPNPGGDRAVVDSISYEYFIESVPTKKQITGDVDRLSARVSTSATHLLEVGDVVSLSVKPSLFSGVGAASSVTVKFDADIQKVLINPVGFGSTAIDLEKDQIRIPGHGLKTGDKVYYRGVDNPPSSENPVDKTEYFVLVIDEDIIKLGETLFDIQSTVPVTVGLGTTGGSDQSLSPVNPQINIIKNNSIIFDVTDPSLFGYKLELFLDQGFRNELVGTGKSESFEVVGFGTVGIGTSVGISSVILNYNEVLPQQLYYNLREESTNTLIESDEYFPDYSRVLFIDSKYQLNTSVIGIASTSFLINLFEFPEVVSYSSTDTFDLSYTTQSKTALGSIKEIGIVNSGSVYKDPPFISTVTSDRGANAELIATSDSIGKFDSFFIEKAGFEFSQDNTLRPIADIPTFYELKDFNTLVDVNVIFGGESFITAPKLDLVNSVTGIKIEDAILEAELGTGSIDSVNIVKQPSGLAGVAHSIYSRDNSNGLTIIEANTSQTGVMTFTVATPVLGFAENPLDPGDEVFVDGIDPYVPPGGTFVGDGFNSKDYKYEFFKVQSFNGGVNPATVTIDLLGLTTSTGIAVTSVNFGSIVKREKYPLFTTVLRPDIYFINEELIVVKDDGTNQETDLIITSTTGDTLKVFGDFELQVNDRIRGKVSGSTSRIRSFERFDGFYEISAGAQQNFGWTDNIGFLNNDQSVIPDNDYYQKLAYSIKTQVEFEDLIDPVNRLVHIAGTKNFVDTELIEDTNAAEGFDVGDSQTVVTLDIINEEETYAINGFDFAVDTDVVTNSPKVTNSIKFGSKKLTSFIECLSNLVLVHDDISSDFVDSENTLATFTDIITYPAGTGFQKFICLVTSVEDRTNFEIIEVVVVNDTNDNAFTVEKTRLKSPGSFFIDDLDERESLGDIEAIYNELEGSISLRFTPTNELKSYNLKVFRQLFDSRNDVVGSLTLNDNLLQGGADTVASGITTAIVSLATTQFNGYYTIVEVKDTITNEIDYAELSLLHDGNEQTYLGQYGFDSSDRRFSFGGIGTFGSGIATDGTRDNAEIFFTNNGTNPCTVKFSTIGFGTNIIGISSVHFKLDTQDNGTERTARIESDTIDVASITGAGVSVVGLTTLADRFSKSVIRIGVGETQALTTVLFAQDSATDEMFTQEFPQIGVGVENGIGTFRGNRVGKFVWLEFVPDSKFIGDPLRIEQYSEIVYADQDTNVTLINDFGYGTVIQRVDQGLYSPLDKTEFELTYQGIPIYAKRFDPNNPTILDLNNDQIKIENHFFQTGQELKYESGSTILGINSESIGIAATLAGGGSFVADARNGEKVLSGVSTDEDLVVGQEIEGPSLSAGSTIVSLGTTSIFFFGDSDGTNVIRGIGNLSLLQLGDTVTESVTETGFGTITAIGVGSIVVDNNVPIGIGSTYFIDRVGLAVSVSIAPGVTTARQTYSTGVTTDIIPNTVFAIRVDNNNIKLAAKKDFAQAGVSIDINDRGSGNNHLLDTTKKLSKTLITIDGVAQDPIAPTRVKYSLEQAIVGTTTFFSLSGIASINTIDILKIDDEFMVVRNVGFAESNTGPITGVGTFNVVNVERAYVGTDAVSHGIGATMTKHRGAFNIVESSVFFTEAPTGAGGDFLVDNRNLPITRSSYTGRTYLKQDYALNELYDDISPEFTGIAKTFTITVDEEQPVGLDTAASGSGIVFINGIYQGQTTPNNPSNVYTLDADPFATGDILIEFSGQKTTAGIPVISETDSVQNEIPTGGRIVSLGFTGGEGIAPLVPAKVVAEVGAGGTITAIVGIDTTSSTKNITNVDYTNQTGIMTVTTATAHLLDIGDFAEFANIEFECTSGYDALVGINTLVYDNVSGVMTVTTSSAHNLIQDQEIKFNDLNFRCEKGFDSAIGISTYEYNNVSGILTVTTSSVHNLNRNMTIRLENLSFACSAEHAGVTTTIFPENQDGTVFNTVLQVNSTTEFEVQVGTSTIGHIPDGAANSASVETGITTTVFPSDLGIGFAISAADYTESTGVVTFTTRKTHNIGVGSFVRLADIEFSCSAEHAGVTTTIFPDTVIDEFEVDAVPAANQFEVNVGISTIAHTYVDHGIARAVKFANAYRVSQINSTTEFETNVRTVGFAHTYIGGGTVETGFTTTKFPDERGVGYAITGFEYERTTGIATITTTLDHNIKIYDRINLSGIAFTCPGGSGITTTIFPDGTQGSKFPVLGIPATNQINAFVGISTIIHTYDTGGEVYAVKNTGPYEIETIISPTEFTVDVGKVGFAHTFVPNRRFGATEPTVAEAYVNLTFGQGYYGSATAEIYEEGHTGTVATLDVTLPFNEHRFESAETDAVTGTGGPYTPTDATYDPVTGELVLTIAGHSLTAGVDQVGLATESICFSCLQDDNTRIDCYPREVGGRGLPDPAYNTNLDISATTTDTITVNVGEAQNGKYTGGRLKFDITNPGTGYTNPIVQVSDPNYSNLEIEGLFRRGIGSTDTTGQGFKVNIKPGAATTLGFGTDFFVARGFELTNRGFSFKTGDKFKPVGIVTGAYPSAFKQAGYAGTLSEDVVFTVLDVFDDTFSSWNFGQVDYIDSIKSLQNGVRTRFPLAVNGVLLSFQKNEEDPQSILIDLDAVLLIFVNGILQQPKKDYFFEGGTSFNFNFTSPPIAEDNIQIYFYRGIKGTDSTLVTVDETIKIGDRVELNKLDPTTTIPTQDVRVVFGIEDSEQIETNIYRDRGIDDVVFRPLTLLKQKRDLIIQEQKEFKVRDALEAQIKPTGRVIRDVSTTDTIVFLDNADFFQYEENADGSNIGETVPDCLLVPYLDPAPPEIIATVDSSGTISTVTIVDGGQGYSDGEHSIAIAAPKRVDNALYGIVGVGTTAVLTATASGGSIDAIGITNPGLGYTTTAVPGIVVEIPTVKTELLEGCDVILGYAGIITGIGTTTGLNGAPLALKFQVDLVDSIAPELYNTLQEDYPIFVYDCSIGSGVTSIDTLDSEVIGIGTTGLTNVYKLHGYNFSVAGTGIMTCNIKSDTDLAGLSTFGDFVGRFSWGALSGFSRQVLDPTSLATDGKTVDVGLTTYPSVVRSGGVGLRNTGNIAKKVFL